MAVDSYEIDPAWPVVRSEKGDEYDESEVEVCEVCNARAAVKIADLWGCEGWVCGYCR